MANAEPMHQLALPQRTFSPLGAFLSYLVPGLGQIVQGRIGKGLLFFVCLYGLFFFGQYLGHWRNVYIYDSSVNRGAAPQNARGKLFETITDRARFFCQFCVGVAAWPAVVQHFTFNPQETAHPLFGTYQRRPTEEETNDILRSEDKSPDLGWMYTVIAGVLNILVIYDALAGPALGQSASPTRPQAGPAGKEAAVA